MATIIDFSAGLPSASAIKASGHEGALLYCSPAREPWMKAKQPPRSYLDSLDAEGLRFGFVWQKRQGGSIKTGDVGRGYAGGRADAMEAQTYLDSVGRGDMPVFFAVDFDISLAEWNSIGKPFFDGAAEVLGRQRVGIYGHSRVLDWAREDGAVAEVAPGRILGWQTKSWSAGVKASDYAVVYQGIHNVDGPDGIKVDVNEIWHGEWGWAPLGAHGPLPAPGEAKKDSSMTKPNIRDWTSRFNFGGPRSTAALIGVCIHTTENDPGTPAENVANYQVTSETGSYHVLADRAGLLIENTDDWVTWSSGNRGNDVLLHLSFVFRAAYSREQWLAEEAMLRNGAWQVAQWCKRYGWPVRMVGVNNLPGITTHDATRAWGGTDHTDPGRNFPWDVFLRYVEEAMAGDSAEAVKGLFMSLSPERQDDLARKIDEIHHELTHRFQSRFVDPETGKQSDYRDTLIGYMLENDKKDELQARNLPAQKKQMEWLIGRVDALQNAAAEILATLKGGK